MLRLVILNTYVFYINKMHVGYVKSPVVLSIIVVVSLKVVGTVSSKSS